MCNQRGDTPLHNAARWNHPALVNELLLYGARYTAANNDHRTPEELTTDETVRDLIWKARRGIIAVGSYSPLTRKNTPSKTTGPPSPGSQGVKSPGEKQISDAKKSENLFFAKLDRTKSPDQESGSPDRESRSPDIVEEVEPESHDFVVVEDPLEHRSLGMQERTEAIFWGQSSDDELLEDKVHPPQQAQLPEKPHPKEEEPHLKSDPNKEGPSPKEEGSQQVAHPQLDEQHLRPHPKGNEKLRSLLVSIENFDRYIYTFLSLSCWGWYGVIRGGSHVVRREGEGGRE